MLVDLPQQAEPTPIKVPVQTAASLGPALSAAISLDGSLAVTTEGEAAQLWTVANHKKEGSPIALPQMYGAPAIGFSPDGKYVAFGIRMTVVVCEVASQRKVGVFAIGDADGETKSLAFSPDGTRMVVGMRKKPSVVLWNVKAEIDKKIEEAKAESRAILARKEAQERLEAEIRAKRAEEDRQAAMEQARRAKEETERRAKEAEEKRLAEIEREKAAKLAAEMAAARAEEVRRASEKVAADAALQVKNWQPQWSDSEDLNALLRSFHGSEDGQGVDGDKHLRAFIRYGTPKNARKAEKGDRFDKEDATRAAAEHREKMRSRRFHLCCEYTWDEAAETGPTAVMLRVRLPLRCHVPFSDRAIGTRDIVETEWWYLAEPKKLQKCANEQEAAQRDRLGQEIYLPENAYYTTLLLRVDAPREVLKAIARDPASHRVNVGITRLEIARPMQLGLYRLATLRKDHFDTIPIKRRFEVGLIGPEKPDYFVSQILERVDDERIQEAVMCHLDRIEVVRATPTERQVVFERECAK